MTPGELDLLEQAIGAWRPRDLDGAVRGHPAWHDLDAPARRRAFTETTRLRALEAALDPGGLSSTGHAVLGRIRGR